MIATEMNMENQNTVSTELQPEAIVVALQAMVADVDGFLSSWLQRIDNSLALANLSPEADEQIRRRISQFQQEKQKWETKRNSEAQQIREQAEQLTEAWLRLEAEQRKFLQQTDPQVSSATIRTPPPKRENTNANRTPLTTAQRATDDNVRTDGGNPCPTDHQNMDHSSQERVNHSREIAVRQFQRLRREIESSRPSTGQL